jgi:hypothetical protein
VERYPFVCTGTEKVCNILYEQDRKVKIYIKPYHEVLKCGQARQMAKLKRAGYV